MNEAIDLTLHCLGCAARVDPLDPAGPSPFRCPNAAVARDIDHVLSWDPAGSGIHEWPRDPSINPFVRYRTLQHAYWLGRALGGTDADHLSRVARLDQAVASVDGTGFVITPVRPLEAASAAIGVEVWAKDDTQSVAGSHKARHLFGLLLHLDARRIASRTPLAIASCGNAALSAATLARAAKRPVSVFVPPTANPAILERLRTLGASITECPRVASDPAGDPCLHRFHDAISKRSIPFCVQGPENGLTIDGGKTIGHELADQIAILGAVPERLFVQVGGGALGSSVYAGLRDAVNLGAIERVPTIHFVQSEGAAPLMRAWRKICARAISSMGSDPPDPSPLGDAQSARLLAEPASLAAVEEALRHAATHRSQYMWPWEEEPVSVATGILDDETYDWLALAKAMLATGGWPIVASESQLERANALLRENTDPIDADETGSASLAGPIALRADGLLAADETVMVLITGARRH